MALEMTGLDGRGKAAAGRFAIFVVFFSESFVLGNWIPRIPDVKDAFGFSASQLGASLFVLSLGTLISFLAGGRYIDRIGLRWTCAIAVPCWAGFITLVPFSSAGLMLNVVLILAGMSIGALEIGMNTAADLWERQQGRRVMSAAHGFWSIGSLVGVIFGTMFARFGFDVAAHFLIIMPLIAVVGIWASFGLPEPQASTTPKAHKSAFKLPSKSILLLCMMPIGIMLVEGAFIDWSALFVRDVLEGGPLAVGSIFAAFATVMATTRLAGDNLLERFGPLNVARVSAVAATVGICTFALAPTVLIAFIGALLSGLGVAIVYPLCMTAAARRPGDAADNVAAMSMISFTAFMVAPPAIGFIADASSLSIALLVIAPLAALSLLLTGELVDRERESDGSVKLGETPIDR